MLYAFTHTNIYMCTYAFLLLYSCCTTALPLSLHKCLSLALLLLYSYFTYIIYVCICIYTPALLLRYYYLSCCVDTDMYMLYSCFNPGLPIIHIIYVI